jgi:RimJ/RimL family protein N-acetyltransferase
VNADMTTLAATLDDGDLRLERMTEAHRDALRAVCARDEAIWPIYSVSFGAGHFDANFDAILVDPMRVAFAVIDDGSVIGMSSFMAISERHRWLEIGTTYLDPAARGTGINARMKRLMLDRAFACGFDRVEIRVDVRNARSQAAVAKLGAVREGVLRRHMITWTGHARDTVVFSILRDEWAGH